MSTNLPDLPLELLEMIMLNLNSVSKLALLMSCRKLFDKLRYITIKMFPRLLEITEYNSIEFSDILVYLQRHLMPIFEQSPSRLMIDLTSSDQEEHKRMKRLQDQSLFLKTYSYSFSEEYLVLVISDDNNSMDIPISTLHIWDLKSKKLIKRLVHPEQGLFVAPQEILVHQHYLITCGRASTRSNLIQVLDLRTGRCACVTNVYNDSVRSPMEVPGSSANRVVAFRNKALCCMDFWNPKMFKLVFFDIPDDLTVDIQIKKFQDVPDVYMNYESSSYFACDQKNQHLVLGFCQMYKEMRYQQFIVVDLETSDVSILKMPDFSPVHNLGIPKERVAALYYETRIDCLLQTSSSHFTIMDGKGNMYITPRELKSGKVQKSIKIPSFSYCQHVAPVCEFCEEKFFDELHMYAGFVITLRSLTTQRKKEADIMVYSQDGQLLHSITRSIGGPEMKQRLYLKPTYGFICLSNASRVFFYSLLTGQLVSSLQYPRYKRNYEQEFSEIERDYAQSGFSIWELRWTKDSMEVVYDLERANPVFFDIHPLKDMLQHEEISEDNVILDISESLESKVFYQT